MQLLGTPSENIWPVSTQPLPSPSPPAARPRRARACSCAPSAGLLPAAAGQPVQPAEAALQQPEAQVPLAVGGRPAPAEPALHVRPHEKVRTPAGGRGDPAPRALSGGPLRTRAVPPPGGPSSPTRVAGRCPVLGSLFTRITGPVARFPSVPGPQPPPPHPPSVTGKGAAVRGQPGRVCALTQGDCPQGDGRGLPGELLLQGEAPA